MLDHKKQTRNGVTVVALQGEAGVAEAQELTCLIIDLAASRPARLVFDLSELTFISSLAMGELQALAGSLGRFDCRLAIAGATPLTRGALHRVRLDRAFELFDSTDAAIEDLSNQQPSWFILKQPSGGRAPATP